MDLAAISHARAVVLSLVLLAAGPTGRTHSPGLSIRQAPACDTLAVPGSGLITLVAPGPNGEIAWTEGPNATEFRVRGARGEARTLGRNGAGPGEFRFISAIGWRHDTLWVYDPRLLRVQAFTDGTVLLREVKISRLGSVQARDDTSFIGSLLAEPAPGRPVQLGFSPLTIGILVPATGEVTSLLSIAPAASTDASVLPAFYRAAMVRGNVDASLWCATAGGSAGTTQVGCTTSLGRIVLHKDVLLAPHTISEELWNNSVDQVARQFSTSRASVLQQFTRSTVSSAAFDLLVNGQTEVWLLRSPTPESTATWDRIAIDGKPRAPVVLSGRLQLRAVDGDVVYAADTDSDGLQALVRCQIPLRDRVH